ncbi:MAG: LamG domain-containing protein [Nannocystaceae bacterium]|nr:LamG domain-containing protein [Nannocystaceae bacterium]
MRVSRAAILGFVTLSACTLDATYACSSDTQCIDGARTGRCELDGYCSFEDETCRSGWRFGAWVPASLAGVCVDSVAATSTSTGPDMSTSTGTTASSSGDATTLAVTPETTGDSTSSSAGESESDSSSSGSVDVLDPDLIAWYRFDAVEAGSVTDHSGNGHIATCETCPGILDGIYASAIETDGVAQHLVVADAPAFTTQTWTLASWVWFAAPPTSFKTILAKPIGIDTANSFELGMSLSGTNSHLVAGWSDDLAFQGMTAPLPPSQQWFHMAATLGEKTATLYLDGELVLEETVTVTPAFDESDVYIGADLDDQVLDNFFDGRIDDLRIYARALTADEVVIVMAGDNL